MDVPSSPLCYCRKPSISVTSWSDKNPGRMFRTCEASYVSSKGAKCSFFQWIDPPICERAKVIIPGLLKKTNAMESHIRVNEAAIVNLKNQIEEMEMVIKEKDEIIQKLMIEGKKTKNKLMLKVAFLCIFMLLVAVLMYGDDEK